MLVDSFPINQEVDLALFRIQYLDSLVDRFVVAESRFTHKGHSKDLNFRKLLEIRPDLQSKVEILEITLNPNNDYWKNEISTREQIQVYIFSKYPNSHFILSDLDEIPSRKQLQNLKSTFGQYHFLTPTYYSLANLQLADAQHAQWQRGVMGHTNLPLGENGGRFNKLPILSSEEPGAHFSWMQFQSGAIRQKLEATPHVEFDIKEAKSQDFYDFVCRYQIDHLGRFHMPGHGLLQFIPQFEFTEIQKELFKIHPEIFSSNASPYPRIYRLFASLVVTSIYQSTQFRGDIFLTFVSRKFALSSFIKACFSLIICFIRIKGKTKISNFIRGRFK
jgi:hypothetical protein